MIKIIFTIFVAASFNIYAANSSIKNHIIETLKNYKLGKYQEALNNLSNVQSRDSKIIGQKAYLSALIYNKLQLYEKALPYFKTALRHSYKAKDLYYEYAQSLLAVNELEISKRAFTRSYKSNFKKGSSLYYMAYISQLLNKPKLARAYYRKVIALGTPQSTLLQGSSFQIAETNLELGKMTKDPKKIVKKYVLPQLDKALKINPTGTIASDIQKRIFELQNEFNLDPLKMVNGRKVSSKKTTGYLEAKISSDNNITLDDGTSTSTTQTQSSSNIYQFEAYINRRFIFLKRFIITPDFRWNFLSHSDSETADVWAQDSYTINPSIKTLTEHTFLGKPASFIFDYDYSYLAKAHTEAGNRVKDGITTSYHFGERFKYFSMGETTIKYSIKSTESYVETSNNDGFSISFDQIASFGGKHILIFLYQYTSTDFNNNTSESNATHLFRLDYINSNLWKKIQFQTGVSLTKLGYKEEASITDKGSQLTTSPMMKFSRTFSKHYKFSLDYTYTSVSSSVASESGGTNYTKSVFSLAFKYTF